MTNEYLYSNKYTLETPKYSKWRCTLVHGFDLCPIKGKEPNWFWRKMQYLVLGFKWVKND